MPIESHLLTAAVHYPDCDRRAPEVPILDGFYSTCGTALTARGHHFKALACALSVASQCSVVGQTSEAFPMTLSACYDAAFESNRLQRIVTGGPACCVCAARMRLKPPLPKLKT